MRAAVLALALAGCVTTNAIVKVKEPSIPVLAITVAADLLVTGLVSWQVDSFTTGASIATTVSVTAVDVAVGCILGACKPLNP